MEHPGWIPSSLHRGRFREASGGWNRDVESIHRSGAEICFSVEFFFSFPQNCWLSHKIKRTSHNHSSPINFNPVNRFGKKRWGQSFRICSESSQRLHAVITNKIRSLCVFLFPIDTFALLQRKSKKNKWLMNVLVVSEVSLCHPDCCHGSTQQCYHSEGLSTYLLFKDVGGLPGCQRHQLQGSNDFLKRQNQSVWMDE